MKENNLKEIDHSVYDLLVRDLKNVNDLKLHQDKHVLNALINAKGDCNLALKHLSNEKIKIFSYYDTNKFN